MVGSRVLGLIQSYLAIICPPCPSKICLPIGLWKDSLFLLLAYFTRNISLYIHTFMNCTYDLLLTWPPSHHWTKYILLREINNIFWIITSQGKNSTLLHGQIVWKPSGSSLSFSYHFPEVPSLPHLVFTFHRVTYFDQNPGWTQSRHFILMRVFEYVYVFWLCGNTYFFKH